MVGFQFRINNNRFKIIRTTPETFFVKLIGDAPSIIG